MPPRKTLTPAEYAARAALMGELRAAGARQQQLADRFGMTQQGVSQALRATRRVRGMPCPTCEGSSRTARTWRAGTAIRRRHQCLACGAVWTSTERAD